MVLNGAFDPSDPNYNSEAMNRMKDIFVDWKFKQDNGSRDAEEALKWWKRHANSYDPRTATAEEEAMFNKAKEMLSVFGLQEADPWDKRNKEMQNALALWAKYKDTPLDQLEPHIADKMKKVKYALLQLKRSNLSPEDMKSMANNSGPIPSSP